MRSHQFAVMLLGVLASQAHATDQRVAIEAMGRAAFQPCFEDAEHAARALVLSDRYLSYLVRYEGYSAADIRHTLTCAQEGQPLPPACFPNPKEILKDLQERDDALAQFVAADSLPPVDDVRTASGLEQCRDVAPLLW
jgi:phosphatidylserine/phosphatidylglycerophosphate/cardiolipin synthase-like enzyme